MTTHEGISTRQRERFFYVGTTLLLPATMKIRESFDRTLAYSRCLRVVNAWARRSDFGADLDRLRLSAVTQNDPYDGRPLRVAKSRSGPIVYAVGDNLTDDGGNLVMLQDIGLGPIEPATEKK